MHRFKRRARACLTLARIQASLNKRPARSGTAIPGRAIIIDELDYDFRDRISQPQDCRRLAVFVSIAPEAFQETHYALSRWLRAHHTTAQEAPIDAMRSACEAFLRDNYGDWDGREINIRSMANSICQYRRSHPARGRRTPKKSAATRKAERAGVLALHEDQAETSLRELAAMTGLSKSQVQRILASDGSTPRRTKKVASLLSPTERRALQIIEASMRPDATAVINIKTLAALIWRDKPTNSKNNVLNRLSRATKAIKAISGARLGLNIFVHEESRLAVIRRGRRWSGAKEAWEHIEEAIHRPGTILPLRVPVPKPDNRHFWTSEDFRVFRSWLTIASLQEKISDLPWVLDAINLAAQRPNRGISDKTIRDIIFVAQRYRIDTWSDACWIVLKQNRDQLGAAELEGLRQFANLLQCLPVYYGSAYGALAMGLEETGYIRWLRQIGESKRQAHANRILAIARETPYESVAQFLERLPELAAAEPKARRPVKLQQEVPTPLTGAPRPARPRLRQAPLTDFQAPDWWLSVYNN